MTTVATPSFAAPSPAKLYKRADRQQWSVYKLDFDRDIEQWQAIDDDARSEMAKLLVPFYLGEERVATQFGGLLATAEDHNEAAYLATQLFDETRHLRFFDRYLEQLSVVDGGDIVGRIDAARAQVNVAVREVFDDELNAVVDALAATPDVDHKLDFITTYHLVIEGMMALAGQKALAEDLRARDFLPDLAKGLKLIARDEARHVAYGVWALVYYAAEDEARQKRVSERLARLAPTVDRALGAPHQAEYARRVLSRRLSAVGLQHIDPSA